MKDIAVLGDRFWAFHMTRHPTQASLLGRHEFDAEMDDLTRSAEDEGIGEYRAFKDEAEAIDPGPLGDHDRVSREVLIQQAGYYADGLAARSAEIAVSGFNGLHLALMNTAAVYPITKPVHADAIVEKWTKIGTAFDQLGQRLRQGVAKDRTPIQAHCSTVIRQINEYLALELDKDPFVVGPARPDSFTDADEADFRDRLADAVRRSIRPGYQRYRDVIADEVLPKARPDERPGLCWLPDGDAVYVTALRRHTTTGVSAHEVHQTGLAEIERLKSEYRDLTGTKDVTEIYQRLRNDPELRFETPDQIVNAAQSALDRAEAAVPEWFGRIHQTPCEIRVMPAVGAKDSTLAYYMQPSDDGTRPGIFFINTTEPTTRTRYEAEALGFHESVPGHHLQLALAQELDLPDFRRHGFITAFHEGWGLYTERLADEMGLYSDDVSRLGMLSFDSWRSGRLVVDTGIHAMGWSRQNAIDFMASNSPQAPNNVANEIDRYIAWPGQATAYKTGQLAMSRARGAAEDAMGDRFDIRGFHDVLLGAGPLPMPVMSERVAAWTAGRHV